MSYGTCCIDDPADRRRDAGRDLDEIELGLGRDRSASAAPTRRAERPSRRSPARLRLDLAVDARTLRGRRVLRNRAPPFLCRLIAATSAGALRSFRGGSRCAGRLRPTTRSAGGSRQALRDDGESSTWRTSLASRGLNTTTTSEPGRGAARTARSASRWRPSARGPCRRDGSSNSIERLAAAGRVRLDHRSAGRTGEGRQGQLWLDRCVHRLFLSCCVRK